MHNVEAKRHYKTKGNGAPKYYHIPVNANNRAKNAPMDINIAGKKKKKNETRQVEEENGRGRFDKQTNKKPAACNIGDESLGEYQIKSTRYHVLLLSKLLKMFRFKPTNTIIGGP